MHCIWGVDFGAKRSGNTAIAVCADNEVSFHQAEKGKDADSWLENCLAEFPPSLIAIDAPLSLPAGWCGGKGDLFYRECDKELKAMSPLFLGGLTARAVNFARKLKKMKIECIETYPKAFVNLLANGHCPEPDSDLSPVFEPLYGEVEVSLVDGVSNEHQVDALMALVVALRYERNMAKSYGRKDEGLIWV